MSWFGGGSPVSWLAGRASYSDKCFGRGGAKAAEALLAPSLPPSHAGCWARHCSAPSCLPPYGQTLLDASSQREAWHLLCYWIRIPTAVVLYVCICTYFRNCYGLANSPRSLF